VEGTDDLHANKCKQEEISIGKVEYLNGISIESNARDVGRTMGQRKGFFRVMTSQSKSKERMTSHLFSSHEYSNERYSTKTSTNT